LNEKIIIMPAEKSLLIALSILILATLACSAALPLAGPTPTPVQTVLPQTEADVPRVTAEEAKAALETGAAIIVDVRDADAYAASHISGAVSIPLDEIENDPAAVGLNKEQWIITYCT
jgi:3-mercaptopyruvate sulfurtransferase SseA